MQIFLRQSQSRNGGKRTEIVSQGPLVWYDPENKSLTFDLTLSYELNTYGFPKPVDYLEQAEKALEKMGFTKASKYHIRFLEWLMLRAWQNRGKSLIRTPEQLVYTLRMHPTYWQKGKKKAALDLIEQGIKMAMEMKYLKSYSPYAGKYNGCFEFIPNNEILRPKKPKEKNWFAEG